jgi:phospholipid/cholesterol/gamma-HCH transport system substrate-binding protein
MSRELRVGIFVAGALCVFGFGVFWIGKRDFRFSSTYQLNAEFANVAGLDNGAVVRVGGIHEGTVRQIILPPKPDQKIRVRMDLDASTRSVLKKDSIAAIRTEGLVGDQYVEISFGSANAQPVRNGDTIGTEPPLELSDMIKKANGILDGASHAMDSVDQTASNLSSITTKFNQGKGTAGALLNDRSLYENINQASSNLRDDTEALKHNFLLRGFFKKRGYEDSKDVDQHAVEQFPAGEPAKQFEYLGKKLFDKPDGAKIKSGKMLDDAGHFLESSGSNPVIIAASADGKGDSDKQRKLTEARAGVVREYLVQHFKVHDQAIKTIGVGKTDDAPDGGEVAILVYPSGTKLPPSQSGGANNKK